MFLCNLRLCLSQLGSGGRALGRVGRQIVCNNITDDDDNEERERESGRQSLRGTGRDRDRNGADTETGTETDTETETERTVWTASELFAATTSVRYIILLTTTKTTIHRRNRIGEPERPARRQTARRTLEALSLARWLALADALALARIDVHYSLAQPANCRCELQRTFRVVA